MRCQYLDQLCFILYEVHSLKRLNAKRRFHASDPLIGRETKEQDEWGKFRDCARFGGSNKLVGPFLYSFAFFTFNFFSFFFHVQQNSWAFSGSLHALKRTSFSAKNRCALVFARHLLPLTGINLPGKSISFPLVKLVCSLSSVNSQQFLKYS